MTDLRERDHKLTGLLLSTTHGHACLDQVSWVKHRALGVNEAWVIFYRGFVYISKHICTQVDADISSRTGDDSIGSIEMHDAG